MGKIALDLSVLSPELQKKVLYIQDWVHKHREKEKIIPTPGYKFEFSCFMFGEGNNLLFRQLVATTDGLDGWGEITQDASGEIIQLVLDAIADYEIEN
ncbi:MAG: hypothetical protein COT26_01225 [Candidatus Kerfeldbacteria bacterium CG08_land_8_20_14_0_20_43_14]|uniref:Uncharacterized protein n=1 Tax=Candidatus Kerfeldbacteria bacterium CG08_land_8_20_14_0_20_43_14 TaxID=2014246 RepID=A0A2H0YQX9_9BACT|nr:MAG: hypothetical protein COT26_01225 [Candidatus Kerfeldbacteria bacterium CG08_land_8_20_14_0_20_43_14]